jgi:beta-N-acetylhexosaminidase
VKGGAVLFLGIEGKALAAREASILRRVRPAGIVLVSRNVGTADELTALTAELGDLLPKAILCLDAEGGKVDRLKGIVGPSPAASELALQPPAAARRAARRIGASLRRFGFALDFAPVVDLDYGLTGNALEQRTFGRTPRAVVARARAFVEGLRSAGVGNCVKHFPGLGAAPADTHLRGATIDLPAARLRRALIPFTDLFAAADAVMVSHAVYPGWGEPVLPATLSPTISHDLLRTRLRYRGVLLSDDLEMGALAELGSLPEIGRKALAAGCDGLLFCRRVEEAPAIARALARPSLDRRLSEASRRIARLGARLRRARRAA